VKADNYMGAKWPPAIALQEEIANRCMLLFRATGR